MRPVDGENAESFETMGDEQTRETMMAQPAMPHRQGGLPEFLDPERSGDSGNPNLREIQTILSTARDGADRDVPPPEDLEALAEDDETTAARPKDRVSLFGIVLLVLCVAAAAVGAFVISSNDQWMADLKCFLRGDITRCKWAKVELQLQQWDKEDQATTPRYGDIVLTYFPQDARVTITQIIKYQQGFEGPIAKTEEVEIKNKSSELKPNEIVEQLPLMNLPVLERERDEEGNIKTIRHYSYRIKIERDGYEPREWTFDPNDWQRLGPDVNWSIPWEGADLTPKPETVREPFSKAYKEMVCLDAYYEKTGKKAGMTEAGLAGMRKEIEIRNGFKSTTEFENFKQMLMADTAWWTPTWAALEKEPCPEITPP